ncbi:hypothetical protein BDB01DRAFT_565365 [Pilobolus umbonatus]|nr:hypothetical protein BDB01DRAFT_565365 [Pilobolus umbonatus]
MIASKLISVLEPIGHYKHKCRFMKKDRKEKKGSMSIDKPDIYSRAHIGINEVTRYLEQYIEDRRNQKGSHTTSQPVIFICKREIKSGQLCQHILTMAALSGIKLIPMPAQSEVRMSQALGLKRASSVIVEIVEDKEESLRLAVMDIEPIKAPWLEGANSVQFMAPNIRTFKTTAPNIIKKKQQPPKRPLDKDEPRAKKVKTQ